MVQMAWGWRGPGEPGTRVPTYSGRTEEVCLFTHDTDGMCAFLQRPPQDEITVMQAVLDGYKDQAIARHLGISIITVRRRVGRYLKRIGAKNRIQGTVVGVLLGWLTLDPELRSHIESRNAS